MTEALSAYQLPVLKSHISQRGSFAESAATGQAVMEIDPTGLESKEMTALVEPVKGMSG